LGLAYKRNTGDARESPALRVAELLVSLGAEVRAVDGRIEPRKVDPAVELVAASAEEYRRAHLVVLLTDHDEIDYDAVVDHSGLIFDTRHRLDGANVVTL
jgi:UDP-N-acetyl-D-glucosamine dehydrogenase